MAHSSSLLLLLLAVLSCWCPSTSSAAATGFVRSWCARTEYPALCDATLAPYAAKVGTSPARLSWAALTVTLAGARNATAAMRRMAAAARDCVAELGDAVGMLRQSVEAMARLGEDEQKSGSRKRKVRFQVDSVQSWASAALTDDDTCMEGFRNKAAGGRGAREAVRAHVAGVAHLTANVLCIVKDMAKQIQS